MTERIFSCQKEFLFPRLSEQTADGCISEMASALYTHQMVDENYTAEVLKRERLFPTGLSIGQYHIAIPHTESEYVKDSAIAVGLAPKSVPFKRMDDPTITIPVNLIFLLAIGSKNQHLAVLSSVIKTIQDQQFLMKLLQQKERTQMLKLIENYF